jgi:Asp-tRNA(Asn)/Glu-tRNA(Gln) amidotransferase A subunit family amidase
MWARAEPATREAFAAAEASLRAAGAAVETLDADALLAPLSALQRLVMRAEGRVAFQPERGRLSGAMAAMADGTDVTSDAELLAALDAASSARAAFDRLAASFDAVLVPSVVGEAPEGLAATGDLIFNGLWTLLHVPCVNLPLWRGPHGLPVGLTLVGPRYTDRGMLAAARTLERAIAS